MGCVYVLGCVHACVRACMSECMYVFVDVTEKRNENVKLKKQNDWKRMLLKIDHRQTQVIN